MIFRACARDFNTLSQYKLSTTNFRACGALLVNFILQDNCNCSFFTRACSVLQPNYSQHIWFLLHCINTYYFPVLRPTSRFGNEFTVHEERSEKVVKGGFAFRFCRRELSGRITPKIPFSDRSWTSNQQKNTKRFYGGIFEIVPLKVDDTSIMKIFLSILCKRSIGKILDVEGRQL